jgi:hypothetical protein
MRNTLRSVEEAVEESDRFLARGRKGMQARGGDVIGNGSCLQRGQHSRRDVRRVFCHDERPNVSRTAQPALIYAPLRWTMTSVRKQSSCQMLVYN